MKGCASVQVAALQKGGHGYIVRVFLLPDFEDFFRQVDAARFTSELRAEKGERWQCRK
jgi:hypothetical protein